eukprot:14906265-Alexandrium_andersonii.AAC.1
MPSLRLRPTLAPRSPRRRGTGCSAAATGAPRLRKPPRKAPGMAPALRSGPGPPPSRPRTAGRLAVPRNGTPSWSPAC